jgi:Mn-dependent DtxR family transcriptional regulator
MLYNLKEKKLIAWNPRKALRLTKRGREIALQIIRNYDSLSKFFFQVLKIKDKSVIHKLSCEIEHHINLEISNALENLVLKY